MDSEPVRLLSFLFFARLWQLAKRKLQLPPVTVTPSPQLFYVCDVLQATQRVIRPVWAIVLAGAKSRQSR